MRVDHAVQVDNDLRPQHDFPPTPPVAKTEMAAAVLAPSKQNCLIGKRPVSQVDVNTAHVTHTHAIKFFWRATARDDVTRVKGEFAPSAGCAMAKEIRAEVSSALSLQGMS